MRSGSEGLRQEENSNQLYLYFRIETTPEALPRDIALEHSPACLLFSLPSFLPSLPPFSPNLSLHLEINSDPLNTKAVVGAKEKG